MCFAYKLPASDSNNSARVDLNLYYKDKITLVTSSRNIKTIADNDWHYTCIDLYDTNLATQDSRYTPANLFLFSVDELFKFTFIFTCV